jgi:hypothetical protein
VSDSLCARKWGAQDLNPGLLSRSYVPGLHINNQCFPQASGALVPASPAPPLGGHWAEQGRRSPELALLRCSGFHPAPPPVFLRFKGYCGL